MSPLEEDEDEAEVEEEGNEGVGLQGEQVPPAPRWILTVEVQTPTSLGFLPTLVQFSLNFPVRYSNWVCYYETNLGICMYEFPE